MHDLEHSSNGLGRRTRNRTQRPTLQLVPVTGRLAMRRFVRMPWTIYADDSMWVPPLVLERLQHLSSRNPYFEHARSVFWLAYRGKQLVGRISAQVDELYLEHHPDRTGFFGLLEGVDDTEVFCALLQAAETWLREQGMQRILGPHSLSINDECGLLVDGFDSPPMLMMGHARPYYAARVQDCGYAKAMDLLAYRIAADFNAPPAMQALTAKRGMTIRSLDRSRLDTELEILRRIFNDAWSENWGFVPFTEAEFDEMGRNLTRLVDDDFVRIAEVEDEPVAMIVLLPNVNELIRDLDGRLMPLGWLKLLWRLKVRYPRTARVPLMGVSKRYQKSLIGTALTFKLIQALQPAAHRRGIRQVELSWILEHNTNMRSVIEAIGGIPYKRYRIYGRDLQR